MGLSVLTESAHTAVDSLGSASTCCHTCASWCRAPASDGQPQSNQARRFGSVCCAFLPSAAVLGWQWSVATLYWRVILLGAVGLAALFFVYLRRLIFFDQAKYQLIHQLTSDCTPSGRPDQHPSNECQHCGIDHDAHESFCPTCAQCLPMRDHHCHLIADYVHLHNRQDFMKLQVVGALGLSLLLLSLHLHGELNQNMFALGTPALLVERTVVLWHLGLLSSLDLFLLQQLDYCCFVSKCFFCPQPPWYMHPVLSGKKEMHMAPVPWLEIKASLPIATWKQCVLLLTTLLCLMHLLLVAVYVGIVLVLPCWSLFHFHSDN